MLDEQTEETPEAGSVNLNEMDALPQQSEMKEEKMRGKYELVSKKNNNNLEKSEKIENARRKRIARRNM